MTRINLEEHASNGARPDRRQQQGDAQPAAHAHQSAWSAANSAMTSCTLRPMRRSKRSASEGRWPLERSSSTFSTRPIGTNSSDGPTTLSFQAVLFESGVIEFHYRSFTTGTLNSESRTQCAQPWMSSAWATLVCRK